MGRASGRERRGGASSHHADATDKEDPFVLHGDEAADRGGLSTTLGVVTGGFETFLSFTILQPLARVLLVSPSDPPLPELVGKLFVAEPAVDQGQHAGVFTNRGVRRLDRERAFAVQVGGSD